MAVTVKLKYLRIAPRKVRLVADLIRGKKVQDAEDQLSFTIRKSSLPVLKLLRSAVSSAENDFGFEKDNLYISEIKVDGGPILKRVRARARGEFKAIQKKTSHITLSLDQIKKKEVKVVKSIKKKEKESKKKIVIKKKPVFSRKKNASLKEKKTTKKVFRRKVIG